MHTPHFLRRNVILREQLTGKHFNPSASAFQSNSNLFAAASVLLLLWPNYTVSLLCLPLPVEKTRSYFWVNVHSLNVDIIQSSLRHCMNRTI